MSSVAINRQNHHQKLACPGCRKQYLVPPAMSGKVAKCQSCGTRMTIGPAKAKKSHHQVLSPYVLPGTRKAGNGFLASAFGGILLMVTGLIAVLIGVMNVNVGPDTARVMLIGGAATSGLLSLAGIIMQFAIPRQSGAKGWLASAIATMLVLMCLFVWAIICAATGSRFPLPSLISNAIVLILGTASFVCYMVFLNKASNFVGRSELAGTAKGLIWYHLFGPVLLSIILLVLPIVVKASSGTILLYNTLMIGVQIATLISNIIVVVLLCQIGTHIRRGSLSS